MIRINNKTLEALIVRGESFSIDVRNNVKSFETGDKLYFIVASNTNLETTKLIEVVCDTFNIDGTATINVPRELTLIDPGIYYYNIKFVSKNNDVDVYLSNGTIPIFKVINGV